MNDEMNTPQPQSDDQTNVPSTEEGTVTTPEEVVTEMPKTEEGTGTESTEETKTDEAPATE